MESGEREGWVSRISFLLTSAGAVIGVGNMCVAVRQLVKYFAIQRALCRAVLSLLVAAGVSHSCASNMEACSSSHVGVLPRACVACRVRSWAVGQTAPM